MQAKVKGEPDSRCPQVAVTIRALRISPGGVSHLRAVGARTTQGGREKREGALAGVAQWTEHQPVD